VVTDLSTGAILIVGSQNKALTKAGELCAELQLLQPLYSG